MNSHMDFIKEQLYALTGIPSPSGFTKKVTDYLLSELTALGFAPERSRKGNVFVTLGAELGRYSDCYDLFFCCTFC